MWWRRTQFLFWRRILATQIWPPWIRIRHKAFLFLWSQTKVENATISNAQKGKTCFKLGPAAWIPSRLTFAPLPVEPTTKACQTFQPRRKLKLRGFSLSFSGASILIAMLGINWFESQVVNSTIRTKQIPDIGVVLIQLLPASSTVLFSSAPDSCREFRLI